MKKVTLLAAMLVALTFASCGGGKDAEAEKTDSTEATTDDAVVEDVVEDIAVDTAAVDTAAAE